MDIDIDFPTTFEPNKLFPTAVLASRVKDGELVKHPCGVFFQNIAKDEVTGLAAIPYEEAHERGYFKLDFLHLGILDYFNDKEEIRELLKVEPDWSLLENPEAVGKLFQLHKHFALVSTVRPKSVQVLADCVAMIRPGKKLFLDSYLKNPAATRMKLYRSTDEDKSAFRRCHAIAYALTIVLQLHLIKAGIL